LGGLCNEKGMLNAVKIDRDHSLTQHHLCASICIQLPCTYLQCAARTDMDGLWIKFGACETGTGITVSGLHPHVPSLLHIVIYLVPCRSADICQR
jgi:hypothetical protein